MVAKPGPAEDEISLHPGLGQVLGRLLKLAPLRAHELRSGSEPTQSLQGSGPVRTRIPPFADSIIVAVGNEGPPETGNPVIVKANKIAGDRTPRKTTKDQALPVTPEFGTDVLHRF